MKTFFDGVFISKEVREEAGIGYPIKIEYFKTLEEENVVAKFGIEVVKTEYVDGNVRVETKEVKNISNDVKDVEIILEILIHNQVTPIAVDDVLYDLVGNGVK